MPRPSKKAKLDFSDDSDSDAGVKIPSTDGFKINEEFAKRFEHNKKREEKHRLEEKYGQSNGNKRNRFGDAAVSSDESSDSDDESEDDAAELATEDVDTEIFDVLKAIKEKDPRVYDANTKFFKEFDPDAVQKQKEDKPMTLHDYQREKLLAGANGDDEDDDKAPVQTYQQEQDQLKRQLVGSMHAAAQEEESDADEDDFMVAKKKPKHEDLAAAKQKKAKQITDDDVKAANQDPETYLSNFMQARAWLPGDGARFQPLESDDSDDDKRAEEFEEAYNMRFEDPKTANEKLQSFARDVGKYGVRREEKSGRAKAREREREQKEAAKHEREEEKARLRKLKVEEAEEKVKRIKEAAGLRGQEMNLDEWRNVIEGDFDDDMWEQEMKRRFGEDYYNEEDDAGSEDEEGGKKRKPKKPKFDDDIDIKDLIPDFEDDEKPHVTLSDVEDGDEDGGAPLPPGSEDESGEGRTQKKKSKKDRLKEKIDARRTARKERMQIEEMVDAALPLNHPTLSNASSSRVPVAGFRYRETSPTSFGLSARDILFADDAALNSYVGLKKMAAFRDPEKKQRDKKKYSKKQRVKQWRKENFGTPDEPTGGFERVLGDVEYQAPGVKAKADLKGGAEDGQNVREGERKKRKRKGKKAAAS